MKRKLETTEAWAPPCAVVPFPMNRRVGKIRRTAEILARKNGADADAYWRQVISAAERHFERIGLPKAEADTQLRAFADAVQAELAHGYRDRGPSDAA